MYKSFEGVKVMKVTRFEDLEIWKDSMILVNEIYELTYLPTFSKDFALKEQIRKSAISIPSNISEGFERSNNIEFKRFLIIAKGSAGELRTQLTIAYNLHYIKSDQFKTFLQQNISISSKISNLISYLRKQNK